MTFLNPLLLIGLAAAAIPLIIHLFNFRRPREVNFSSLVFLKELQKSTMRRVQVKQWLLLLLRTLAIACLVLAFARPTLTGGLAGTLASRSATSTAIVIDNSLSMTLRDAQGEYLRQAKTLAADLAGLMEPGDEMFVLTTATPDVARSGALPNQGAVLDAIGSVEAMPGAAPLEGALERAAARLKKASNPNQAIYLISDVQRSTLLDTLAVPPSGEGVARLLPVGERTYGNVAVTDVGVVSRIVEVGEPVTIEATLTNFGQELLTDYVASVYLEGERVAQAATDLAPGAAQRLTFTATPQQRGWLAGDVRIEDDAFGSDNLRHFTLHVPERRRLLVVQGQGQRADFLNLALSSDLTQGRIPFDVETIQENALTAASLGAYDGVVLVGPRDLSSGEVGALTQYVRDGGGLLFFPGPEARAEDYNALLGSLGGGTFSGFSGTLGSGEPVAAFDRLDLEHPLFDGVFETSGRRNTAAAVESPDVYYAMNYTPASGTEQTLIDLSSGFPFLQELRDGRGVAFLMAVAPDLRWSDLPQRGLFIPLLYRAIYYLSSSESVAGEQLVIGEPGELRLTGVEADAEPLQLVAPDGEAFVPEQRSLFGAVLLQIRSDVREPGIYDVQAGDDLVRRVAFNLPRRESDLRTSEPAAAAEALAEASGLRVDVFDAAQQGGEIDLAGALIAEQTGVELWNVFLLLALGFMVAEMLVARQWRPEAVAA